MKKIYSIPLTVLSIIAFSANAQKETREKPAPVRQERRVEMPRMETPKPAPTREPRTSQPPVERRTEPVVRQERKEQRTAEPRVEKRTEPFVRQERKDERTSEPQPQRNTTPVVRQERNETTTRRVENKPTSENSENAAQERRQPYVRNNNAPAPQQRINYDANRRYPNGNRNGFYPDYRRPYSYVGQRYYSFYRPRFHVHYNSFNYYYSDGFFYSPFQDYYQVIIAPIGIRVFSLPYGYRRFYIGSSWYYYYGGTYYRNNTTYYEVVDAPLGSILPELPKDAKTVVINDHKYFEHNGTYFQETLRNDETWYTVVGKNGVLSTKTEEVKEEPTAAVGDIVSELPEGFKVVVLNNQKFYVADETYYQEIIANNTITYKVIAKPVQQ